MSMRRRALALLLFGLALFAVLVAVFGGRELFVHLREAGPGLVLAVAAWHLTPLFFDVVAWYRVLPKEARERVGFLGLYRVRWMTESVNALLPVMSVGGELMKLRLLYSRGIRVPTAAASIVVDLSLALFAEIAFVALGLTLLGSHLAQGGESAGGLERNLMIGASAIAGFGVLFWLAQKRGLFRQLGRLVSRFGFDSARLGASAEELDREIRSTHARRGAIAAGFLSRASAWLLGTGEVWIALRLLGHPVSLGEALAIESLTQACRTAGFAIPSGLGVQEGGTLLVGRLYGLDDSMCLALALARRGRELALGLPGLSALTWGETRTARTAE